jgi:hypothetical protein
VALAELTGLCRIVQPRCVPNTKASRSLALPPTMTHPAIDPRLTRHFLVRVRPQPAVHVHGQAVQLREAGQLAQQQHDQAAALHRLYGARQEVRREGFKVLGVEVVCRERRCVKKGVDERVRRCVWTFCIEAWRARDSLHSVKRPAGKFSPAAPPSRRCFPGCSASRDSSSTCGRSDVVKFE